MATPFFDFHFHPLFKKFITHYEEDFPTKRFANDLLNEITLSNKVATTLDDLVLHILQSQSSISQCIDGHVKLGVAAFANLEYGFGDSRGFISNLLKGKFSDPMDKKYFELVKNGRVSYYRMFLKELDLYRKLNGVKVKETGKIAMQMLTRKNKKDLSKIEGMGLLVSIEGGHNLYRKKIGQTLEDDIDNPAKNIEDDFYYDLQTSDEVGINPALSLQRFFKALWKNDMDMMYLTVTHLSHISEQFLATHAFGMKLLKHPTFFPTGNGLTTWGKEVIDACYNMEVKEKNKTVKTPVLVDIKHLGLKSRQDFYHYRKEKNYQIPLVASHMGVTGYTLNEWKNALRADKCKLYNYEGARTVEVQMKRKRCGTWGSFVNNDFTFNPWSINLMDEDIVEVLDSNGLIGLSLDVRILGFQAKVGLNTGEQSEHLSTSDFQSHFPYLRLSNLPAEKLESMAVEAESWLLPTKEDRHPLALCFNLIHIAAVGIMRSTIENPWKHICIGSDYDGLIEPVKICPDISNIDDLKFNLLKWLPVAADAYQKENGGQMVLPDTNLNALVDDILYKNGLRFTQNWMNGTPGAVV